MPSKVLNKNLPLIKKQLVAKQNGVCPLCKRDITRFDSINQCVDHDHDTGVIRAVLCRNCNGIEGKVRGLAIRCATKDGYEDWLKRLADYLILHRTPQTTWIHPTHKNEAEKRMARNAKARRSYRVKVEAKSGGKAKTAIPK